MMSLPTYCSPANFIACLRNGDSERLRICKLFDHSISAIHVHHKVSPFFFSSFRVLLKEQLFCFAYAIDCVAACMSTDRHYLKCVTFKPGKGIGAVEAAAEGKFALVYTGRPSWIRTMGLPPIFHWQQHSWGQCCSFCMPPGERRLQWHARLLQARLLSVASANLPNALLADRACRLLLQPPVNAGLMVAVAARQLAQNITALARLQAD